MNETLEHHGILGMKWGVRRYQNKDGTWTKEGKEHRSGSMTADDYFKLSPNERVNSPIGKELLSGGSYNNYVSACEKQESIESKALADEASDFYNTAHAVAENYKANAGENYDQETYDYYDKDGGLDAHNKILNEYAKVNEEYGKARRDEENAIDALYAEAGPISKKYFGDDYRLSYQDVNELAFDRRQLDKSNEAQPVEAKGMFTEKELDAVANRNIYDSREAELNELMLLEMLEKSGVADSISYEDYNRELSKFEKDPYNYVAPTKDETKHSDDSAEDFLMHYGILGMKWGIRRYQNKDGSLTAAGRKRYGDDIPDGNKSSSGDASNSTTRTPAKSASEMTDQELNQALNRLRMEQQYNELTGAKSSNQYQNQQNFSTPPSNTGNLSNAELQAYINRLDMEKRYKQLTAPPPKELNMGQKFVKEILPAVAMEVGRELVKNTMRKALGLEKSNDGSDNDGGGKKNKNNNNNDGGGKQKNYDKQFSETNSRIDKLANAINNLANNKQNSKSETKSSDSSGDEEKSSTSIVPYSEHRKSIIGGAKAAANAARENKKNRDALQDRLKGYRDRREAARNEEEERRKTAANNSSDYYRSMWTYGM